MSSGHRHRASPRLGQIECDRALADPRVQAKLAIKPKIDRTYDIPYLAGYSRDGRTVYIDRHMPLRIRVGSRLINPLQFLLRHEAVEKAVLDTFHYGYAHAHEVATYAEHRDVRAAGHLPGAYEKALLPFIKSDSLEKVQRVPRDLDLTPYVDSKDHAALAAIHRAQGRPQANILTAG